MSGFDLNTIPGFEAITSLTGGLGGLLGSLTGAIAQNWDIQEASYGHNGKQILFHVFKSSTDYNAAVGDVHDASGHRKIPIVFPYQDGQSSDDLGRKGEVFEFNVLIFGPQYKAQYQKLLKELNDPTPGTLIHPVRGSLTVAAEEWDVVHASDKRQAVALKIRFIEHSFSVDYSTIPASKNVPSALTTALGFLSLISKVLTAAQSIEFVAKNTTNLVAALIGQYQTGYTATLSQLNQTFNPNSNAAIPTLLPTVAGQDPSVYTLAGSANDAFQATSPLVASQSVQLTAALASQQAVDSVAALCTLLNTYVTQIEATEQGQGALIFYDQVISMKQSIIALQEMLEVGLQTSSNTVVTYKLPRDMSVREVCFANGLFPDNSYDLEVLNPQLLSVNLIPKGTIVQVPT